MTISEMQVEDLDEVLEIERSSFPTPWSARAVYTELTQNMYARYLVARLGGKLVGYAGMWVVLDEAHVTNIAVDPRYRRRHIGSRLLRELMVRACRQGASRMTLEVRRSNLAAQKLYARHGFRARGVRRGYYSDTREDAIVMWNDDLRRQILEYQGPGGGTKNC